MNSKFKFWKIEFLTSLCKYIYIVKLCNLKIKLVKNNFKKFQSLEINAIKQIKLLLMRFYFMFKKKNSL